MEIFLDIVGKFLELFVGVKKPTLFSIGRNATSWFVKALFWDIKFCSKELSSTKQKLKLLGNFHHHPQLKDCIDDSSKISLKYQNPYCLQAFEELKKWLVTIPIVIAPDWTLPFRLMCNASDFAVGVVLAQRKNKAFHAIYYASYTLTDSQLNYTTTKKELLAVVFSFDKFRAYLVGTKVMVYIDHFAIKYLEFDLKIEIGKVQKIKWLITCLDLKQEMKAVICSTFRMIFSMSNY
ncbi:Retrovirus-related Pol polyprotein from transposon 17.6 [Gossypium australe]|uniref:Retrovirus-related Pol polyprotein from transposon 17.6 n=1 Tax=Gossypium australe TaxID=47621 RepID=A0A5B6VNF4_9ROSI|nr:Retrovirus-related Pol polyprotein from transposon 17.6 [Gossypium australe]